MFTKTIQTHVTKYLTTGGPNMSRMGGLSLDDDQQPAIHITNQYNRNTDLDNSLDWRKPKDDAASSTSSSLYNNSSSKVPPQNTNTILINNYPQTTGHSSASASNSSITIYTQDTSKKQNISHPTSLLDRLNIRIDNHYGEQASLSRRTSTSSLNNNDIKTISLKENKFNDDPLTIGHDVLVENKNGYYFAGRVIAVTNTRGLVKYRDSTEQWSDFSKMKKSECRALHDAPDCIVCNTKDYDVVVEECSVCFRSFHPKCSKDSSGKYGSWYCGMCVKIKDKQLKRLRVELQLNLDSCNRKKLPYNLKMLSWNQEHTMNSEEIYCYCGQRGIWMLQMLQCSVCRQWFHEECVNSLKYPLFLGDRFFIFVCGICNNGTEFLRRLEIQWLDIVHILLFNLTIFHKRAFFDLSNAIAPYARDNWHNLQTPLNLKALSLAEIRDQIGRILRDNEDIFKCYKNKWSLRKWKPPIGPNIVLPLGCTVTEQYLKELFKDEAKLVFLPVVSNDYTSSDAKFRNAMTGRSHIQESDNHIQLEMDFFKDCEQFSVKSFLNFQRKNLEIEFDSEKSHSTESTSKDSPLNTDDSSSDLRYSRTHRNERKRKRLSKTFTITNTQTRSVVTFDPSESSDEITSLEQLIPPLESFEGENNPFRLPDPAPKKQLSSSKASKTATSKGKMNKSQDDRTTLKRKMNSKDIDNIQDVKRRRLRLHSDASDKASKDWLANGITSSSSSSLSTTPTDNEPPVINGRRLRQRRDKQYFPRRNSIAGAPPTASGSSISNGMAGAIKNLMNNKNKSATNSAAQRIRNGEIFVIRGQHVNSAGKTLYLVEWEKGPS